MLIAQELLERALAFRRAFQIQREMRQLEIVGHDAFVVRRRDPAGAASAERDALAGVDRLGDAICFRRWRGGASCGKRRSDQREQYDGSQNAERESH